MANRLSSFSLVLVLVAAGIVPAACSSVGSVGQERSIGRQLDDTNASVGIKSAMLRSEGFALDGVDVEVTEGSPC